MSQNEVVIEKYDYIYALRGFAVLGVILTHCGYLISGLPNFVQNFAIEGSRGVQLFFIISSFTLFNSYGKRINKEKNSVLNFFIRRFFRIAPMFYLGMLYYLFSSHSFSNYSFAHLLSIITFTNGWNPQWINSIVPGGWSITVEMTFYLFIPFLFKLINNINKAGWALFISLFISNIVHWVMLTFNNNNNNQDYLNFIFYFFPNQLPVFMLGILLYFYKKNSIEITPASYNLLLQFSIFMMIALVSGGWIGNTNNVEWIPHIILWGVAFLIFAIALSSIKESKSFIKKIFLNKLICFYGEISFSAYLVHFALLPFTLSLVNKVIIIVGFDINPTLRLFMLWFMASLFTLLMATLTYYSVEKSGIKLGNKLIRFLDNKLIKHKPIKE